MLKSIEKALRLSEIREKLNDLNGIESPTDAQKNRGARAARVAQNGRGRVPRGAHV